MVPVHSCVGQRQKTYPRACAFAHPVPMVIKLFSCSTQLSMNFHLVIKMKIPTIKTFFMLNSAKLSMKEVLKNCQYFKINKRNKFHAQLS